MQNQTDSSPDASTPAEGTQFTQTQPDDTAFHGLQPTVETVPYHAPPAQGHAEAVVSQTVKQSGPILPESEPVTQAIATPSRRASKAAIATATLVAACVCVMIVFAVHERSNL